MGGADVVIVLLQCYFMLMNLTVERTYCHAPIKRGDTGFLVPETVDFCERYNPLFLLRPEWMRVATCVSAYVYCPFYALTIYVAVMGKWRSLRTPLLMFIGAKLNAIAFYHAMEFTSFTPPPNVLMYFAVEGPYLVSIALALLRIAAASGKAKSN